MLIMASCKSDKIQVETSSIQGDWELVSATRDGKLTRTVDGALFSFDFTNQSMTTDLLGSEASSPFHMEKSTIVQEIPGIEYEIIAQTDTSLQLTMTMRNTDFGFLLKRPKEEE